MNLDEPDLERWREAYAALAEDAVPRADCPGADRLWDAARGRAAAAESRTLVAHSVECPACAESWRLAMALSSAAPGALIPLRPRAVRPWWGGFAAAAAALLVVFLAVMVTRAPASRPPEFRGSGAMEVRSRVPDGPPLPRAACLLRWSAGPPGTRYDLQVGTGRLAILHSARGLEAPEERVPAEALHGLPAGAVIYWQVEAVAPDGTRALSPAFASRIE